MSAAFKTEALSISSCSSIMFYRYGRSYRDHLEAGGVNVGQHLLLVLVANMLAEVVTVRIATTLTCIIGTEGT